MKRNERWIAKSSNKKKTSWQKQLQEMKGISKRSVSTKSGRWVERSIDYGSIDIHM